MSEIEVWMHPKMEQLILKSKKRYKIAKGGRGSSKSLTFGVGAILWALQKPGSRILCVRGTQNKISESSLQILKDAIYMMGLDDKFIITENTLRSINGSEYLFYGAKNPHTFKSLQGIDLVWVDEATELKDEAWTNLVPTIREDGSEIWISFNPEYEEDAVWQKFMLTDRDDVEIVTLNWQDNPYFPEVLISELEYDKKTNRERYEHIWEGKLRKDIEGALWHQSMFKYLEDDERAKIILDDYNIFEKIVVALDPSGTSNKNSDACGIVVVGKYAKINRWCILEDQTKVMSPLEWASKSVALYNKYGANKIIYESNYGGDMVRDVIKSIDNLVPIDSVRASKGKMLRAEPIVALYEQGLVDHAERFVDLEYEYTTFNGDPKQKSPNRLDAAVWGLTYLFNKKRIPGIPNIRISI